MLCPSVASQAHREEKRKPTPKNVAPSVQVEFVPTDDRAYSVKMGVRVASTTKLASMVLQGRVSRELLDQYLPFFTLFNVLSGLGAVHYSDLAH